MLDRLKHFLVPQESNNYRAKILHHSSLSSVIGFFLISQLVLSSILIVKPAVLGYASQISPERIIELTNQERAKVGAPALKMNAVLNEAAQRKAGDMFAFNYWAHNSPSGRNPWTFFKEVGYRYLYAGENLARDFSSPEAAIAAWMASPTHKENLLNPKYQEIGLSVVDGTLGGTETTLIVQLFGAPIAAEVAQKPQVSQPAVKVEEIPAAIEKPQPAVEEIVTRPAPVMMASNLPILAKTTGRELSLANPFLLTKNLGLGILGVIIGVIIIDGFIVFRQKTFRLSGHSLAHTFFLIGAILMMILSTQGVIL